MAGERNEDELIAQYSGITGESTADSRHNLEAFQWDIAAAVEDHYSRHQGSEHDSDHLEDDSAQTAPVTSGNRSLGGSSAASRAIPASGTSSQPPEKSTGQKKFATLGDFNSSTTKDDSDDDENHDLFAGGEKSGLAVQNPDDLKKRILEKAQKSGGPRPKEPTQTNHFAGSARTLGGDDAPSVEVPAAQQPRQRAERVDRTLHFWRDGFSVDDGDLYHIDDPRNGEILNLIRQGRAPLHIMNVQPGQEVDVEIKQHDEEYVKPKLKYKPFGGQGNRLGSPTPGSSSMPGSFTDDSPAAAPPPKTATEQPASMADESKPTVTLRISLATGVRLTSRFNTDQTIGDVYDFVGREGFGNRQFVLQTTFPTTELKDKSKVLGDVPEFKRGGAVVQKYL